MFPLFLTYANAVFMVFSLCQTGPRPWIPFPLGSPFLLRTREPPLFFCRWVSLLHPLPCVRSFCGIFSGFSFPSRIGFLNFPLFSSSSPFIFFLSSGLFEPKYSPFPFLFPVSHPFSPKGLDIPIELLGRPLTFLECRKLFFIRRDSLREQPFWKIEILPPRPPFFTGAVGDGRFSPLYSKSFFFFSGEELFSPFCLQKLDLLPRLPSPISRHVFRSTAPLCGLWIAASPLEVFCCREPSFPERALDVKCQFDSCVTVTFFLFDDCSSFSGSR